MNTYMYKGPVMLFDKCIADKWVAYTTAVSEKKAMSNLKYQFKKETNRVPGAKISLPGKLEVVA